MYIPKGNSTAIIMTRDCSDFVRYKTLEKPLSFIRGKIIYNDIDPFFSGDPEQQQQQHHHYHHLGSSGGYEK